MPISLKNDKKTVILGDIAPEPQKRGFLSICSVRLHRDLFSQKSDINSQILHAIKVSYYFELLNARLTSSKDNESKHIFGFGFRRKTEKTEKTTVLSYFSLYDQYSNKSLKSPKTRFFPGFQSTFFENQLLSNFPLISP